MYFTIKKMIDFVLSITSLIILTPLFIIIAISIKLESPGPIFFKQVRIGHDKKPFSMYKFRTMRVETPSNIPTWKLNDPDYYITKVGRFLRKTSIDELPQLLNIIKGDMSIIGPRPVVSAEEILINERTRVGAYSVLPGLTGLAQINGRDKVAPLEKARLDGIYAENMSFYYDCKIFIKTFAYVLKKDDIVEGKVPNIKSVEFENKI